MLGPDMQAVGRSTQVGRAVLLHPTEDGTPGKTNVLGPLLVQLKQGKKDDDPLWNQPHATVVESFNAAVKELGLESMGWNLYNLRHEEPHTTSSAADATWWKSTKGEVGRRCFLEKVRETSKDAIRARQDYHRHQGLQEPDHPADPAATVSADVTTRWYRGKPWNDNITARMQKQSHVEESQIFFIAKGYRAFPLIPALIADP